jgi:hypothetical protein
MACKIGCIRLLGLRCQVVGANALDLGQLRDRAGNCFGGFPRIALRYVCVEIYLVSITKRHFYKIVLIRASPFALPAIIDCSKHLDGCEKARIGESWRIESHQVFLSCRSSRNSSLLSRAKGHTQAPIRFAVA